MFNSNKKMSVIITVDVEAHRVIDEITGPTFDGLQKIINELDANAIKATFFVDFSEVHTWGFHAIKIACDKILSSKHDIQLHIHPHHYSGDRNRWMLGDYSYAEKVEIIKDAISNYKNIVGKMPLAFRAGAFGIDEESLEILFDNNIKIDCSYMEHAKQCKIDPWGGEGKIRIDAVKELPLIPVVRLTIFGNVYKSSSLDFNWLPNFYIKKILFRNRVRKVPAAVILMHSSSLSMRKSQNGFAKSKFFNKKLTDLLFFLNDKGFRTETVADWATNGSISKKQFDKASKAEGNFFIQYYLLLYQSWIGKGFKKHFLIFYYGNIGIVLLAILLTLWILK